MKKIFPVVLGLCCLAWTGHIRGDDDVSLKEFSFGTANVPDFRQTPIFCSKGKMVLGDFLQLDDLTGVEKKHREDLKKLCSPVVFQKNGFILSDTNYVCPFVSIPVNTTGDVPDRRINALYKKGTWILNTKNSVEINKMIWEKMSTLDVKDAEQIALCCEKGLIHTMIEIQGRECKMTFFSYNGNGDEIGQKTVKYHLIKQASRAAPLGMTGIACDLSGCKSAEYVKDNNEPILHIPQLASVSHLTP